MLISDLATPQGVIGATLSRMHGRRCHEPRDTGSLWPAEVEE